VALASVEQLAVSAVAQVVVGVAVVAQLVPSDSTSELRYVWVPVHPQPVTIPFLIVVSLGANVFHFFLRRNGGQLRKVKTDRSIVKKIGYWSRGLSASSQRSMMR
jgi:hypothetical protein